MSGVDLAVPVLKTHGVWVLTVDSIMSATRAVAAESNAVTVVNSAALLTAPHAFLRVTCPFLCDAIVD